MSKFRKGDHPPPDGRVRQSQLLTTYGPGAMIDLLHDAVLVGGLEFWSTQGTRHFDEPRLRQRLQRQFPRLRDDKPFVVPPAGDEQEPSRKSGIQVLEFPTWFVCQNPKCRALVRCGATTKKRNHRYVHEECGGYFVPVRFVMACVRGHLEEFPWVNFVHGASEKGALCQSQDLVLYEGPTGDFSELVVVCKGCGSRVPLIAATGEGANRFKCHGRRPWLGDEEECSKDLHLRLLVRTASNSYFSEVVSSLDIPEPRSAAAVVLEHWALLSKAKAATLPVLRDTIPLLDTALKSFTDVEVLEAVQNKLENRTAKQEEPRTAEFHRLVAAEPERPGDYPPEHARFYARTHQPKTRYPVGVERVVLVHRLREVRVQTGFTRFEARTPDLQGEYPEESLGVQTAPIGSNVDWLPGIEIHGEGFFLQLSEEAVRAWEDRVPVHVRAAKLEAGHAAWRQALELRGRNAPPFYGARFYLLHSLAHLIIQAVSLECGYSASAIRERIYCADRNAPTPMAAILFSTGTTGSEGTLGGLLEEGRRVHAHLARAIDQGRLCSNDPICAYHDPSQDPTERYLEGAACHGCLFIAEPSCEQFNRFLDRALVVPTLGQEDAAFFTGPM